MASPHINPWGYNMEYTISNEYDGKPRRLYQTVLQCGHLSYVPKHLLKNKKYCSVECRVEASKHKQIKTQCSFCFSTIRRSISKLNSKSGLVFCNRQCKESAQSLESGLLYIPHYKDGLSVYRERAFKAYGPRCAVCGYDEYKQMLDVDHIDSDRSNNSITNLQVLCVWHHALKTRGLVASIGRAPALQAGG